MMRSPRLVVLVALAALASAGCGRSKAEAAIASAEQAFAQVKDEAQNLVPADADAVGRQIAAARASHAAKRYGDALAAARDAAERAKALGPAIAARKQQLVKAFDVTEALLGSATARISELKRQAKLPPGIDRKAVQGAGATVAELSATLGAARRKLETGALQEAAVAAKALPIRAQALLASLGGGPVVAAK